MSLTQEVGAVSRQVDHALAMAQDQISQMMGIVRRVEDLADRVTGVSPPASVPSTSGPQPAPLPGLMGALQDLHTLRDQVGGRLAAAVARIEELI